MQLSDTAGKPAFASRNLLVKLMSIQRIEAFRKQCQERKTKFELMSPNQRDKLYLTDKFKKDREFIEIKETKIDKFLESLDINSQNLAENTQRLDYIKWQVDQLKEMINFIQEEQVRHYSQLLVEGSDCRDFGMSWVVKSLWLLDQELTPSHFPNFLDRKAIQYFFTVTFGDLLFRELSKNWKMSNC